ncbi:hypothetical protein EI42_05249 [Thermosporothrix hazakensis]|jgi:predicted small integral membrane protein|uniref:Uncharacterized protein n=1 Tax=Thermosporothrix hazakensis TaxID=644383 RepID=A0A326TZB3_THEHA|nr:hypothetical protein EI42_05249 [Thermosporothrix hazakensis]
MFHAQQSRIRIDATPFLHARNLTVSRETIPPLWEVVYQNTKGEWFTRKIRSLKGLLLPLGEREFCFT